MHILVCAQVCAWCVYWFDSLVYIIIKCTFTYAHVLRMEEAFIESLVTSRGKLMPALELVLPELKVFNHLKFLGRSEKCFVTG